MCGHQRVSGSDDQVERQPRMPHTRGPPVRSGAWTRCTCSSIQAEKGPVKAHFAQRRNFPSSGLAEKPASITRPTGKNYSWKLCPISPFFIKHKEIVLPVVGWSEKFIPFFKFTVHVCFTADTAHRLIGRQLLMISNNNNGAANNNTRSTVVK